MYPINNNNPPYTPPPTIHIPITIVNYSPPIQAPVASPVNERRNQQAESIRRSHERLRQIILQANLEKEAEISSHPQIPIEDVSSRVATSSAPQMPIEDVSSRVATIARKCLHCGTRNTPQWRRGPQGKNTLCNACGIRYANRTHDDNRLGSERKYNLSFLLKNRQTRSVEERNESNNTRKRKRVNNPVKPLEADKQDPKTSLDFILNPQKRSNRPSVVSEEPARTSSKETHSTIYNLK